MDRPNIISRSRDTARDKEAACDAHQRPAGAEQEQVGHDSAFPMMVRAAAQDRAAAGTGRGWWGFAQKWRQVAGQHFTDADRAHAARPLRPSAK